MSDLTNLIQRIKKRDHQAQTEVYHQFKKGWFRICLRYNKNREDASDALQNALINIFQKIEQFDLKKGNFLAWSNRIVINENLMLLRKKVSAFNIGEIRDDLDIFDQNETPVEKLSVEELTNLVQTLPHGYRAVFNLYVMDGYTHPEIAKKLNISSGTSKSQLFKARKLLQGKLEVLLSTEEYGR